jgi:hypothetical protein
MSYQKNQIKKRQHYVWANYLSRWGNGTNNVFYLTKKGKIANDSIRGIAVEDYFYKITKLNNAHIEVIKAVSVQSPPELQKWHKSLLEGIISVQKLKERESEQEIKGLDSAFNVFACNILEDLHSAWETSAKKVLEELANERIDILEDTEIMCVFMNFFGHQITRTKPFKELCLQSANLLKSESKEDNEWLNVIQEVTWFLNFIWGMNIGYSLFISRNESTQSLLINDTDLPFITSDQPIINIHPALFERDSSIPKSLVFYYPISPRVAYIYSDSDQFKPRINYVDKTLVSELNIKIAKSAMLHIIGNNESVLLSLKKFIGHQYKGFFTK